MSEVRRARSALASSGAVLAGFAAVIVSSIGTDVALRAGGVLPPLDPPVSNGLLALAMPCAGAGGRLRWS
jgi:hypothetical protein